MYLCSNIPKTSTPVIALCQKGGENDHILGDVRFPSQPVRAGGAKNTRDCSRLGNSFSLYPFATEDTGQMLVGFFLSSVKEVMAYSSLLVTTECC